MEEYTTPKQIDTIVVGSGIAGILIAYELLQKGKSIIVLNNPTWQKSSMVSSALINPMTGKHLSPYALSEVMIPQALESYRALETLLDVEILEPAHIVLFHEDDKLKSKFHGQAALYPEYLKGIDDSDSLSTHFHISENGLGCIHNIWRVNALKLNNCWMKYLETNQLLYALPLDYNALKINYNSVSYLNLNASNIVFCEGAAAMTNPLFKALPFTSNRGEALILSIPELPQESIYHGKVRLVPIGNQQFWCGSNYQWRFSDLEPSSVWRKETELKLKQWLKVPYEIVDHIVATRPTTAGQLPFIGMHPSYNSVAILNGLGTKGYSSGPYWAKHLATLMNNPFYKIPNYKTSRLKKLLQ
jgi:glycine/D-amino acid oxidase-like deaminating enzyme